MHGVDGLPPRQSPGGDSGKATVDIDAPQPPIGYVVAVAGSKVSAVLSHGPHDDPGDVRDLRIGALVKIPAGNMLCVGMVATLSIEAPSRPPRSVDRCIVEIDLFGEGPADDSQPDWRFERGVSEHPALGAPMWEVCADEMRRIYAKPGKSSVRVGNLNQGEPIPAFLAVDGLLGKHFAVLGTTGSGKSCSVVLILRSLLESHANGHVLLLDPHNEYSKAFGDLAEVITPETLHLPYWMMNFAESVEVFCSADPNARDPEQAILREAILQARREFAGEDGEDSGITVDTPVPYQLHRLQGVIETGMVRLDNPEGARPYLRLLARFDALRHDPRYAFMFAGIMVRDTMASVLSRILRIPVDGRPITIVDLSGVPGAIVDVVVSLLSRTIFDFAVWAPRSRSVPLLMVCEEAHRYIPRDQSAGFQPTREAIARIAKEGRKYGVSLGLVTQRPSELSETILSQCNTLFALRMSNEADQAFLRRALPESGLGLIAALPALRSQEAVVVGEAVTVPMRIRFDYLEPEHQPHSATAPFSEAWRHDMADTDFVEETLARWRQQTRSQTGPARAPASQPSLVATGR